MALWFLKGLLIIGYMSEEEIEKETVTVYYHIAKYPPSWGGAEYWVVIEGEEELTDIVKSVALRFGKGGFIPGNSYEEGRFAYIIKEKAFRQFQSLWNEKKVCFEEVSSEQITDLAEYY